MSFVIYTIDCETCGLKIEHDIIEISMHRSSDDVLKTWYLKPVSFENIQPDALRVNGHKLDDLKIGKSADGSIVYKDRAQVVVEIENWMMEDGVSSEERILLAQNPAFDLPKLQKLWDDCDSTDSFVFGKRPFVIDTRQIALFIDLCNETRSEYYNLSSLVEKYGCVKRKSHRSDSDVRMTVDVFNAQAKIVKTALKKV